MPLPIELRGNKLIEVQENFVLEQKQNVCRRLMLNAQRSKIQNYSHQTFLTPLGKHLPIRRHLYVGIAQIAITPPALKRALWGTFFQARFYHFFLPFLPFFILFTIFHHFFSE